MTYRLTLLGPISLAGPDGVLTGRPVQRRRLAVLALLGSAPDFMLSRDTLMALLWPEADPPTARHLLSDSLYVLRRALGASAIVTSGEELRLETGSWQVDVAEVQDALERQDWERALRSYRGDFLEGFFVRNSPEFERWVDGERARLREGVAGAASALADSLEAGGEEAAAVPWRRRALQHSPFDERAFRALFDLLIRLENRGSALEAAREFTARLAADLGTDPTRQTQEAITAALSGALLALPARPTAEAPATSPRGTDIITRNLVLQGRQLWHQRTPASLALAISYYEQALQRDETYASAWFGLADAYIVKGGRGLIPRAEASLEARRCLNRAREIAGDTAEGLTSIGGILTLELRWGEAEASLREALAINPSMANAHHWLALAILTGRGNLPEAVESQEAAARLSPLAPVVVSTVGWHRYLMRDFARSRESYQKAVDLDFGFDEGHAGLARTAAYQGDRDTVLRAIEHGRRRRPDLTGDLDAELGAALAVLGDAAGARATTLRSEGVARPIHVAAAWAALGETDQALSWMNRDEGDAWWSVHLLRWDPRLDSLRGDRRFTGFLSDQMKRWGVVE